MNRPKILQRGVTLVELMIAVAIIGVVVSIAIPAYNNYISEARRSTARANVEPLRIALEDYFLENDTYIAGKWNTSEKTLESGALGWKPDGNAQNYDYEVKAGASGIGSSYEIVVVIDGITESFVK